MMTRLKFVVFSTAALIASWGGWFADPLTWSDGVL